MGRLERLKIVNKNIVPLYINLIDTSFIWLKNVIIKTKHSIASKMLKYKNINNHP